MKKADKTYMFRDLLVAETQDELNTPLWTDFYFVDGKEILNVNPKKWFIELSEKDGKRINIYGKYYKDEIESYSSQMPQASHKLEMEIVCAVREVVNQPCEYCCYENDLD